MLELVMIIASCVIMYRVAEAENRSGIIWAVLIIPLTFLASMILPIAFVRVIIALILDFGLMMIANMRRDSY